MAGWIEQEINMLVTSDPNQGAINRSADGSTFTVQLDEALAIPKEARNVSATVMQSTVWWVVPNIIQGENDMFYITAPNTADVLTNYTFPITQGLYDLTALNTAVQRELQNQGAKINPDPVISFSPDNATQRVQMTFNYPNMSVDFSQPQTPRDILGFDPLVYQNNAVAPLTFLAPNVAGFNTVNYFLIHSDLTYRGIRFNNNYNQTIAQVLIDVPPGSQIVSAPYNPAKVNCQELAGTKRTKLRFWLTDDQDRTVNTNGEYWTARIAIRFMMPL